MNLEAHAGAAWPDADLAGYHVYRSEGPGRSPTRLTAVPQGATTYVDTSIQAGRTYAYTVTAGERARRANESVPSAEATLAVR